jgi:hypothetical protein
MTQWEYSRIDLSDVPTKNTDMDLLEEAGKDGWELILITGNNVAYLKRPLPEAAPATKPRSKPARTTPS